MLSDEALIDYCVARVSGDAVEAPRVASKRLMVALDGSASIEDLKRLATRREFLLWFRGRSAEIFVRRMDLKRALTLPRKRKPRAAWFRVVDTRHSGRKFLLELKSQTGGLRLFCHVPDSQALERGRKEAYAVDLVLKERD